MAAGLHHWVDGTMGIARNGETAIALAPNGPHTARHHLHEGGFIAGLQDTEQPIRSMRTPVDHVSGGPLWRDPDDGTLVLVYHAEQFRNGDAADYWSFIGLAASEDDGVTFHDLGPALTSPVAQDDDERVGPIEMGPGSFVERDGWFHLYFMDRSILTTTTGLGVARIAVDDLRAALRGRLVPRFAKYHDGRFDQPGLGGPCTDLLPGTPHRVIWFDVLHLLEPDVTVLVHSTVTGMDGRTPLWNHVVRTSADGVRWSEPALLYAESVPAELIYLTLDSGGPCQRRTAGRTFDIYRVSSPTSYRWDGADLERLTVTWGYDSADG